MLLKGGLIYEGGRLLPMDIAIENGRVCARGAQLSLIRLTVLLI